MSMLETTSSLRVWSLVPIVASIAACGGDPTPAAATDTGPGDSIANDSTAIDAPSDGGGDVVGDTVGDGPDATMPVNDPVALTAAWANTGEDKVAREELRVKANGAPSVVNSVWNGTSIALFGAGNEVVSFNLVLEAATTKATQIRVSFASLTGPGGATIGATAPTTNDGVFDWTKRDIELFYVRYLPIKGLSLLSYEHYDERHVPKRMQRPWTMDGQATGTWTSRPDHDRNYPDIAVPAELVPTFDVASGSNQSIWSDIYIPKSAPAGVYQGSVQVYEAAHLSYAVPIALTVEPFALPDVPAAKTMVYLGNDLNKRYTSVAYPNAGTPEGDTARLVRDRHFQLAHRHKIALIDSNDGVTFTGGDAPSPEWIPRLDGTLFSVTKGYRGPGQGLGNGVFSIGTYGSWSWKSGTQSDMWMHTNAWETWFQKNAADTYRFLYLIDESTNYAQTQQWAQWMASNTGVGKALPSFATIDLPSARASVPALDIATSWFTVGDTTKWQAAVDAQLADSTKRYFQYNGKRPSQGSFCIEDDGIALRELAWAQYKKGVQRWFFWESTYYNDFQGGRGQTDVFQTAATFSGTTSSDPVLGETGWNHSNGDGLLFYPGKDTVYPASSYGVNGPFASLRMKHWRRGIQDVDYLTLAAAKNPAAVKALVQKLVPKAMWEYGVTSAADPTYVRADISWSIDPNDWESARKQLVAIIVGP